MLLVENGQKSEEIMNEKWINVKNRIIEFWQSRTSMQKGLIIASFVSFIALIGFFSFTASNPKLVPLYSNLSPQETGQIKANLDARGIKSEVSNDGTTINVPKNVVDTLMVELAAEGIPNSGNIDYSFFGQNAGFGMTDNEFNVLKLEAMQTELSTLIKGIDGVDDAKVMINLPQESIWVNEQGDPASASIVLKQQLGYKFSPEQINALYHLVSKSVPNLPIDNIVIMNQMFEYFEPQNKSGSFTVAETFGQQHQIKKQIEKDIQTQVQQMLSTMMGRDKVRVMVTADLDFTQMRSEENIVTPVDEENMEGLAVSVERITEAFTGSGAEGIPNDAGTDIPAGYEQIEGGTGDYERTVERINRDVNRIRREIVESPYKVRDLGIQVMVEPPTPDDPNSLPAERVEDIEQLLGTIVRTTIDKDVGTALTDEAIQNKIFVTVQPFNGKIEFPEPEAPSTPTWVYYAAGGGVLLLVVLLFIFSRRRKSQEEEPLAEISEVIQPEVSDINEAPENEGELKRKQLEKMAKDKPEDFAKLLRSWLAED